MANPWIDRKNSSAASTSSKREFVLVGLDGTRYTIGLGPVQPQSTTVRPPDLDLSEVQSILDSPVSEQSWAGIVSLSALLFFVQSRLDRVNVSAKRAAPCVRSLCGPPFSFFSVIAKQLAQLSYGKSGHHNLRHSLHLWQPCARMFDGFFLQTLGGRTMLQVSCQSCGRRYAVSSSCAGKTGRCKCGQPIKLAASSVKSSAPLPDWISAPVIPTKPKKRRLVRQLVTLLVAVAILSSVIGTAALILHKASDQASQADKGKAPELQGPDWFQAPIKAFIGEWHKQESALRKPTTFEYLKWTDLGERWGTANLDPDITRRDGWKKWEAIGVRFKVTEYDQQDRAREEVKEWYFLVDRQGKILSRNLADPKPGLTDQEYKEAMLEAKQAETRSQLSEVQFELVNLETQEGNAAKGIAVQLTEAQKRRLAELRRKKAELEAELNR